MIRSDSLIELYLQSGEFWAGVIFAIVASYAISLFWVWYSKRWLKVRQFFQPTRKPGKLTDEKGPSPFDETMGCFGNLLLVLVVVLGMGGLLWLWMALGE